MSTMNLDEARAVLAQIGAGEESTAEEVYRAVDLLWIEVMRPQTISTASPGLPPTPRQALAALDTLRAAREEKLRGLVRRLADWITVGNVTPRDSAICAREAALLLEARQAMGEKP